VSIAVTYLGHASALIELGGLRLLTDPLLRHRVGHLRRRSPAVDPVAHERLDAVLISHAHHDHLDLPSLRKLDRDVPLLVAPGVGRLVSRLSFRNVTEMPAGESIEIGPVSIDSAPASHGGRRGLLGERIEAIGFVLAADRQRAYFAGDTDLFAGMSELAPLDVALLPVWGWGPSIGSGHLDPGRAAQALKLLRPRVAIPIHWGTLYPIGLGRFRSHLLHKPPREFADRARDVAPSVDVRIDEPGKRSVIDPP
jgi:L-ascorbate metabolism protein UlaG (beta-lactamase superfamily)